jgi:hypothetical protein
VSHPCEVGANRSAWAGAGAAISDTTSAPVIAKTIAIALTTPILLWGDVGNYISLNTVVQTACSQRQRSHHASPLAGIQKTLQALRPKRSELARGIEQVAISRRMIALTSTSTPSSLPRAVSKPFLPSKHFALKGGKMARGIEQDLDQPTLPIFPTPSRSRRHRRDKTSGVVCRRRLAVPVRSVPGGGSTDTSPVPHLADDFVHRTSRQRWAMYGRRPRCKRNLTISEAFGCGHVFGL